MLQEAFTGVVSQYSTDEKLITALWDDVGKHYNALQRHYHNLTHLSNLLTALSDVQQYIDDWDTVVLATFYHDIIYNVVRSDNEEKSAAYARQKLALIQYPEQKIIRVERHILATKGHSANEDADTNYFTDADLSVLGASWSVYSAYADGVRKEYALYPDIVYKPGRRNVLKHFLDMKRIFKTEPFFSKYEDQARQNLRKELAEYSD